LRAAAARPRRIFFTPHVRIGTRASLYDHDFMMLCMFVTLGLLARVRASPEITWHTPDCGRTVARMRDGGREAFRQEEFHAHLHLAR
jgi:hypothetical protein